MPHVRPDGLDFVVTAYILHPQESKVLLINHKALNMWLAPGGHVGDEDPHEDTDQALAREIKEETGLVLGETVHIYQPVHYVLRMHAWQWLCTDLCHHSKQLLVPWAIETHDFPPVPGHRHLALVYVGRATTDVVQLEADAHHGICWFDAERLQDMPEDKLLPTVCNYAVAALLSRNFSRAGGGWDLWP